jgi:hypothetical protein
VFGLEVEVREVVEGGWALNTTSVALDTQPIFFRFHINFVGAGHNVGVEG